MNFKITLLLAFSFVFCSAQDSTKVSLDTVLARIAANQIPYKTFSERAMLTWDDGSSTQQFTGTIRVKKDSIVWMSLGMMGFEGVRTFITPDSFKLLNKLSNEYLARDYNFIQSWILLPVNFGMLQQIITGEKISIDEKAAVVTEQDSSYVLYLESDKLWEQVWVDTQNYTLKKLLLKDKLLKQDLTITFEGYNSLNQKPFSYKRQLVINRDGATYKLDMDIRHVHCDEELSFPFEVSEKYKKVE
jgi:outer membrane lipoprotein-sorting protein